MYLNPFGHWDDQARPIRLNGTYDSMFGMTVCNIGDLDQDGYGGEKNDGYSHNRGCAKVNARLAVCKCLMW